MLSRGTVVGISCGRPPWWAIVCLVLGRERGWWAIGRCGGLRRGGLWPVKFWISWVLSSFGWQQFDVDVAAISTKQHFLSLRRQRSGCTGHCRLAESRPIDRRIRPVLDARAPG